MKNSLKKILQNILYIFKDLSTIVFVKIETYSLKSCRTSKIYNHNEKYTLQNDHYNDVF